MSELLTAEVIKYLQANGLDWVVGYAAIAFVGWGGFTAFVTWFFTHRLTIADLRSKGIEARLKSGEMLKEIESSQKILSSMIETQGLHLREFLVLLKTDDMIKLESKREELCRFHSKDYSDALDVYLERCIVYVKKSDFRDRALIDFIPALQSKIKLLDALNLPEALCKCGNPSRYQINKTPMTVFLRKIRRALPLRSLPTRLKLLKIRYALSPHFRPGT